MRNKTVSVSLLLSVFIIIIGVVVSVAFRLSLTSLGIEDIDCVDDLESLQIQIGYARGKNGGSVFLADLKDNADYYVQTANASYVLIVEPTGDLHQYRASYSQSAKVLEVIAGKSVEIGEVIDLFDYGCLENQSGVLTYTKTTNLMYPDNKYLVFVEASDLNSYTNLANFRYIDSMFACIKLDNKEKQKHCTTLDFHEYNDTHYFCASEEVLDAMLAIEHKILTNWSLNS